MRLLTAQTTENPNYMADAREKANERPIDGPYPELANEVRKLLGYNAEDGRTFLTSRMASRKTGVNHATITTTVRGDRPSEGTILKLAKGLGGDVEKLFQLAGYDALKYFTATAEDFDRTDLEFEDPTDAILLAKLDEYSENYIGMGGASFMDAYGVAKIHANKGDRNAILLLQAIKTTFDRIERITSIYDKLEGEIETEQFECERELAIKDSEYESIKNENENEADLLLLTREALNLQRRLIDVMKRRSRLMNRADLIHHRGARILSRIESKIRHQYKLN